VGCYHRNVSVCLENSNLNKKNCPPFLSSENKKNRQFGGHVTKSDLDPKLCGLSFGIVYLSQPFLSYYFNTSPSFEKYFLWSQWIKPSTSFSYFLALAPNKKGLTSNKSQASNILN